jgi:hypothetical protein
MVVVGEAPENGKKFSIMDVVIPFGLVLGMESYSDVLSSIIFLGEDGSCGKC